jgi:hypothetical protein
MKKQEANEYNGPDKVAFMDTLADYEEHRFAVMRATSLAGKVLATWEKKGGNKDDIRQGYDYRQMLPEEQRAEVRRRLRVDQWMGLVAEEDGGQGTFKRLFDMTPEPETGIGGAPIGSKLSVGRAKAAGFNDGKAKNGPSLQEGIESYGFAADSEEALAYAEYYGEGLLLRPAPKEPKGDKAGDSDGGSPMSKPGPSALDVMTETIKELDEQERAANENGNGAEPKKRGRKPKMLALPGPDDEIPTMLN